MAGTMSTWTLEQKRPLIARYVAALLDHVRRGNFSPELLDRIEFCLDEWGRMEAREMGVETMPAGFARQGLEQRLAEGGVEIPAPYGGAARWRLVKRRSRISALFCRLLCPSEKP